MIYAIADHHRRSHDNSGPGRDYPCGIERQIIIRSQRQMRPIVSPKLKEIRKAAVSEAEQQYLKDLISFTSGDNNEACRNSGLSRSRFYTLLRKYQAADGR